MLQQEQRQLLPQQRQQRPLLVSTGEILYRGLGCPLDMKGLDLSFGARLPRLTLDHESSLGLGQGEMFGQIEPWDQPLLQARRRHESDTTLEESMIRAPEYVLPG